MGKFLKVEDLKEGETYLALRRFNAKRIIYQPCKIISTIPRENGNLFQTILVRFLDGEIGDIRVYVSDGECKDSLGQPTLKPIGNFFEKEMKRIQDEMNYLAGQFDLMKAEYDKINE